MPMTRENWMPLDTERGCIVCGGSTAAVWSPDGSVFAYLWKDRATGESSLYIQNLQGKVKAVFTMKAEVSHPLWSPDGQRIAVFGEGGFVVIDIARQTVSQQYWFSPHGPKLTGRLMPRGIKLRWSPDGRKILVSGRSTGLSTFVVDTNTGGIKRIGDRPGFAFWGPNSDAVYYFDIIYKGGDIASPTDLGDFSLQKLDGSPPIKVMKTEQLKKALRLTGADLPAMMRDRDEAITLSPSGSRLAITLPRASKETDIYLYDLSQGEIIAINAPFQSFRTKDLIFALEWAPDEKSLAAVGPAAGGFGIKVLDLKKDAWRTLAIIPHVDGEPVEDYYAFGFKTISWTQ
jgi:Tol biopolymer transport system component